MDYTVPLRAFVVGTAVLCWALVVLWCAVDARLRGKSAIVVALAVLVFFPFGWLA